MSLDFSRSTGRGTSLYYSDTSVGKVTVSVSEGAHEARCDGRQVGRVYIFAVFGLSIFGLFGFFFS